MKVRHALETLQYPGTTLPGKIFSDRGISFTAPGFYDDPDFLGQERQDSRFLEIYARYVEARCYDDAYLADAATKIDIAARALEASIQADGRLGACVDASGMLGRPWYLELRCQNHIDRHLSKK